MVPYSKVNKLQTGQELVQTSSAQDNRTFSQPSPGASLVQALEKNQRNYLFSSVNLTTTYQAADGSKKIEQSDIGLMPKAFQCGWCELGFHTKEAYRFHKNVFPSGCEEHRVCFGPEMNVIHARRHRHDSCFVSGCMSEFREEEGWEPEVIVKHVKKAHGLQGHKK